MNVGIWIIFSIAIVVGGAPVTGGKPGKVDEKNFAKFTRRNGLPLPPALRGAVLARLKQRERGALTGGFGGIALGALAATVTGIVTRSDSLNGLLVMVPAALGMSIGSYRGALRTPDHLAPEAPRVARSHSTTRADYTTTAERWAVWLVPAALLFALAAAVLIWALAPVKPVGGLWVPALMVAGVVAVLVAWFLLDRAGATIVDRPQHAHNDLELAWDDALRAAAIRDVQDSAISTALLATFGLLAMAGSWIITPTARDGAESLTLALGVAAFVVGLGCWSMLLVPWLLGRAQGNPSLRLWGNHRFQEA